MPAQYPGNSAMKAARAKAGGGFESAIEALGEQTFSGSGLSITSAFLQGETASIETTSGVLGARTNAAPWVYMEGDRLWVRGVEEVTLEAGVADGEALNGYSTGAGTRNVSVFDTATALAERTLTSQRSNFAYRNVTGASAEDAKIAKIRALMPDDITPFPPKTTNKFVFTCRVAMSAGAAYMREIPYTSISGVFNVTGTDFPGEEITLTESDGVTVHQGKIIAVDTGLQKLWFTSSTFLFSGNVYGGTVDGVESQASATLATTGYANYSTGKYWRLETQEGVNPPEANGALQDTTNYTSGTALESDLGRLDTAEYPADYSSGDSAVKRYAWDDTGYHTLCSELIFNNGEIDLTHFKDGASWSTGSLPITLSTLQNGPQLNHWANDYAGGTGAHHFMRMELEYVDDDIPRVVIGDAPEIASCQHVGTCMSTAWDDVSGAATVRLNYGTIPPGSQSYLFVRSETGWHNPTTGVGIGVAP